MNNAWIKIVVKEPGQGASVQLVKNSLDELRKLVGGQAEYLPFPLDYGIVVIAGAGLNNTLNFRMADNIVAGTAVFLSVIASDGDIDFISLSADQVDLISGYLDYGTGRRGRSIQNYIEV